MAFATSPSRTSCATRRGWPLVLIAQDLLAWTARICLDGALARAEPATVRYQLLHVGARLVRRGRDLHLRIDSAWPWRDPLEAAFGRMRAALC